MKSWKAWALVLGIFATGVLAGAFGMRAYMARHLPEVLAQTQVRLEERFLEVIDHEVGLSAAQKQAILPLLREAVQKGERLHEALRAQLDPIMRETDIRIAAQLDPGQRAKFWAFRERMERLRKEGRLPPPPPPGFPPPPPRP